MRSAPNTRPSVTVAEEARGRRSIARTLATSSRGLNGFVM